MSRFASILVFSMVTFNAWSQQLEIVNPIRHTSAIKLLNVSPDRTFLVSTSDWEIVVWDIGEGKPIKSFTYSGGTKPDFDSIWEGYFNRAVFSRNGQFILASGINFLSLWSLETGERLFDAPKKKPRFFAKEEEIGFLNNDQLFFVSNSENVEIRSTRDGSLVRNLKDYTSPKVSSDQKLLILRKNASLFAYEVDTWKQQWKFDIPVPQLYYISSLAVDPTGNRQLAVAFWRPARDERSKKRNGNPSSFIARYDLQNQSFIDTIDLGPRLYVQQLDFTEDLQRLLLATYDQNLALDLKSKQLLPVPVNSPDKGLFQISPDENFINVIDPSNGQAVRSLKASTGQTLSVRFSPDGTQLAVGNDNNKVAIWDLKNGLLKFTLPCLRERFHNEFGGTPFAYSSDSKQIATRQDTSILLWSANDGRLRHELRGSTEYSGLMGNPTFSPDGKQVAAGDLFGGFLFSADTGKKLQTTNDPIIMEIDDAVFSSNGKYLFMNSGEGYRYLIRSNDMKVIRTDIITLLPDGDHYLNNNNNIVNISKNKVLHPLMENREKCYLEAASPDGKLLAIQVKNQISIISYPERNLIKKFSISENDRIVGNSLSKNGRLLFIIRDFLHLEVLEVHTGKTLLNFWAKSTPIKDFDYHAEEQLLAVNHSGMTTLLSLKANSLGPLANLIPVDADDWLVTTPDDQFDGSPAARSLVSFQNGKEIMKTEELKNGRYRPSLLLQVLNQEKP